MPKVFQIDYSKRGTAKCRKCKKCILKDVLRIGKPIIFKKKDIFSYFHINCIFESFKRVKEVRNTITSISQLSGFNEIKSSDQTLVTNYVNDFVVKHLNNSRTDHTKQARNNNSVESTTSDVNQSNPPIKKVRAKTIKRLKTQSVKILFTNADQFTATKKSELENRIRNEKPVLVAVSEAKTKRGFRQVNEFEIDGFQLFHSNLDTTSGRGIAVYAHASIQDSIVQVYSDIKFEEYCFLDIKLRNNDKLLFGCIYRSPTASETSEQNNLNLNLLLKDVCKKKYSHVCLVGDFNFPTINWNSMATTETGDGLESNFLEAVHDCFLYQHIIEPTRIRGTDNPSLLDLILTDEEFQVSELKHQSPLGASDHSVISFNFHCYIDATSRRTRYLYHKADIAGMKSQLTTSNWVERFTRSIDSKDVEKSWNEIKQKIHELRNTFVPIQSNNKASWNSKWSVPIDKKLQDNIRKKHRLHQRWIRSQNESNRLEYTRTRNKVKSMMRGAKRNFEKDISNCARKNPKKFWSYIRRKLKTRAGIAPLENPDEPESLAYSDAEKASILQRQFCSVFVREPDDITPVLNQVTDERMPDVTITEERVIEVIKSFKTDKSCGPDEVDVVMLQELIDFMSLPITLLLKKSLSSGVLPEDWLNAIVTPVFKKGSNKKAENYRPISLTSVVCKIMESIIKQDIVKYFMEKNLFSNKQHGFISGRSTTTQLLKFIDHCLQVYATGGAMDVVYLDFAKAFDKVPHRRLLAKLRAHGISGPVLNWIKSFLNGRKQCVRVNGTLSDHANVLSGIPQGSVLGPILFVIYINDLPNEVASDVLLFADDTKIFRCIKSIPDSLYLQDDLQKLVNWSNRWLLKFNADKCHVLTLGKHENIVHAHNYKMDGVELEHVFEEKDLGVIVDTDLSFDEHITTKIKKANAMAGMIRRSFTYLESNFFKKLYVTFVRPHLEINNSVWAPYFRKHVNAIEKVQMRAAKCVDGFNDLSYEEQLRKLDLPTLAHRRKRGDMIEVFKHAKVYDKASLSTSIHFRSRPSRKHDYQITRLEASDGVRGPQRNSFYYRTAATWNELPKTVVNSPTVTAFKKQIDDFWKYDPTKYVYDAKPYHHLEE